MFSFFKKPQSYYEDDEIERRMKEKNLKKKLERERLKKQQEEQFKKEMELLDAQSKKNRENFYAQLDSDKKIMKY